MELNLDHIFGGRLFGPDTELFQTAYAAASRKLRSSEASIKNGALIREHKPIAFAAAFFACIRNDWPIILANPSWGETENDQLAQICRPDICFGDSPFLKRFARDNTVELELGTIAIPTGGTTAGLKLAVHRWSTLSASAEGTIEFLGSRPVHSACQLPLYHVSGIMQLVRSYLSCGRIHFGKTDLSKKILSFVPTQLARVMRSPRSISSHQKADTIFVGGASLSDDLRQAAIRAKLPIVPVYGMTETAAMCAAIKTEDLRHGVIGAEAIGDTRFAVNSNGCITVDSSALFFGYLGRRPRKRGPFVTGDVGHIDADERLYISGRADRLINTGGEKVDPAEIERVLSCIEGVDDCAVIGVPDVEWGQRVIAFAVAKRLSSSQVNEQIKGMLSPFKRPKQVIVVDAIPTNAIGKPDYPALETIAERNNRRATD